MRRAVLAAVVVLPAVALLAGCGEQPLPSAPSNALDVTGLGPSFAAQGRAIRLDDQCDVTFNEHPPASCTRTNGGITFAQFTEILQKTGSVGAWHITPAMLTVDEGETLPVTNVGGEVHTYTEVEEFGGGIDPTLNAEGGFGDTAPECAAAAMNPGENFILPGGTVQHTFDEEGVEKYQCCIHPWMRQTVRVRS